MKISAKYLQLCTSHTCYIPLNSSSLHAIECKNGLIIFVSGVGVGVLHNFLLNRIGCNKHVFSPSKFFCFLSSFAQNAYFSHISVVLKFKSEVIVKKFFANCTYCKNILNFFHSFLISKLCLSIKGKQQLQYWREFFEFF